MPTPKRRRFEIRQKQERSAKRKPVISGVTGLKGDPFDDLQSILKKGFVGESPRFTNAFVISNSSPSGVSLWARFSQLPKTYGDRYGLKMLTRVKRTETGNEINKGNPVMPGEEVFVGYAHPGQIKTVYIQINPRLLKPEREARMELYRKTFPRQRIEFK